MTADENTAGLVVRRTHLNVAGLFRDWADAEGWNPGTHDTPAFHAADPDGFFVGELGGKPAALLSCVRYGGYYGFLGQYIVHPDCRGRGFGLAVWAAGMVHLAGRAVGLEGVLAQVPNYERSGFRFHHHTVRYAGVGGGTRPAGLTPLTDVPFADLSDYDRACFPARREAFLRAWAALPGSVGLADVRAGRVVGYGVLRAATSGRKVGPLFADDADTARRLLAGLAAAVPGEAFCVDIPDGTAQPAGGDLVRAFGLTEVFRTARMHSGDVPAHDPARVFGVTSLELG